MTQNTVATENRILNRALSDYMRLKASTEEMSRHQELSVIIVNNIINMNNRLVRMTEAAEKLQNPV